MPLLVYIWGPRRLTDPTSASGAPSHPFVVPTPYRCLSYPLPSWLDGRLFGWLSGTQRP